MNIYYPSVERGASEARRERHTKVAEFLAGKGVELFGRPNLHGSNRVNWLKEADGVVVERLNFTRQLERECRYATRIGKEVLVVMDHTNPRQLIGARQPSASLRQLAMDGDTKDNEPLRIIENSPAVDSGVAIVPSLVYVQSAITVFLQARGNRSEELPMVMDRFVHESAPQLNPGVEEDLTEQEDAMLAALHVQQ